MKTRILSLLFAILMALTVLTIPAAAATAAAPSSALAFLDEFLSNLQKGNTEKAFCAMDDTRHVLNENVSFSNLTAPEKAYISRIENGQAFKDMYDKDPIKDYKILEETSNGVILTHLYFKDGSEAMFRSVLNQTEVHSKYLLQPTTLSPWDTSSLKMSRVNLQIQYRQAVTKTTRWMIIVSRTYMAPFMVKTRSVYLKMQLESMAIRQMICWKAVG